MSEENSIQGEGAAVESRPEKAPLSVDTVQEVLIKQQIHGMSWKKKVIGILVILLTLTASGFGVYKYLGSSNKTDYLTAQAAKSTISDTITATGTLEPVKKSEMGFKSDNTITALNVQPGDRVKQGDILAEQDATTLQASLQQAYSSLEQDQISVKSAEMTCSSKLKTLERQQTLFDAGAISQSDLETARNDYTKAQWDVETAQAKLVNDQAKVAQAQSDYEGAVLVAPFDGIIGAVNGQVGQINGLSSSSSTLLTVMSEDLQMSALVNEADIARIQAGQEVEFTSSAFTNKTFQGTVLRITPEAQTVSNVQYYPVLISCVDPDHQLFSGMSVSASIIVNRKTDVLTVPMMAVSYAQTYLKNNPTAASGAASAPSGGSAAPAGESTSSAAPASETKQSVILVMQNNQPVVKNVVLGMSDGSNYEVIEGLNEGDTIIVGSNTVTSSSGSSSSSSSSSSNSNSSNQRNQGGMGGMGGMGGPPPGM
ncbi:MAG: efflux RND transporter periplasmic adaptor subunit [Syntrophomonas sp.]|jgi:HlyD family secretion protein